MIGPSEVESNATMPLVSDEDVVRLRKVVRDQVVALGFGLADQTKVVTAASELARNTLRYGGGGHACLAVVQSEGRRGIKLDFVDQGPGIADVEMALKDGYTTGGGLGMGLGGSRRLCDDFAIETEPGKGTTVSITKWKRI